MCVCFLGSRIRYLREKAELKQRDVAVKFSISENTWSQYENNKRVPSIEVIKKIAGFFNVSTDYLLCLTDEMYDPQEEEFKELIGIYSSLSKEEKRRLVEEVKSKYA